MEASSDILDPKVLELGLENNWKPMQSDLFQQVPVKTLTAALWASGNFWTTLKEDLNWSIVDYLCFGYHHVTETSLVCDWTQILL